MHAHAHNLSFSHYKIWIRYRYELLLVLLSVYNFAICLQNKSFIISYGLLVLSYLYLLFLYYHQDRINFKQKIKYFIIFSN